MKKLFQNSYRIRLCPLAPEAVDIVIFFNVYALAVARKHVSGGLISISIQSVIMA